MSEEIEWKNVKRVVTVSGTGKAGERLDVSFEDSEGSSVLPWRLEDILEYFADITGGEVQVVVSLYRVVSKKEKGGEKRK